MSARMKTAKHDAYEVSFHPAFASRCAVRRNGRESDIYRQKANEPYVLDTKKGETHPKKHEIRIRAADGREIVLTVDDPDHCIAQLQIKLYDEKRDLMRRPKLKGGGVRAMQEGEGGEPGGGTTITIDNDAQTCPPYCDNDPGDLDPAGG